MTAEAPRRHSPASPRRRLVDDAARDPGALEILVNCAVAPGPFWTALQPSGGQFPDHLAEFGADTPLGRPGQPAEIAPLYVLLASSEASFATGQVFGATGGEVGP